MFSLSCTIDRPIRRKELVAGRHGPTSNRRIMLLTALAAVVLLAWSGTAPVLAQEAPADAAAAVEVVESGGDAVSAESEAVFLVNNIWILIAAALVLVMHLGFATLESGLTRSKNSVNILSKNVAIIAIGLLTYYICGFNLMYPGEFQFGSWLGFAGFGIAEPGSADMTTGYADGGYTYYSDFIFQAMFAATAATIVSGAVAERIKFLPFILFSALFVSIAYPLTGSWKWGEGWLDALGFYDFAGSTIVHAVGGAGALVGALMLGPRLGKYGPDGRPRALPGHSMPLATIGVFLLFLGWFGFNGGSVLSAAAAGDAETPGLGNVSIVFVTTALAAAAGAVAAMIASAATNGGKVDLSMALNGILAGLVGITAGADAMGPLAAIAVGLIAGVLVVFSVYGFDKLRIDDPVGAISVHLVCGIWGTLAVGIFGSQAYLGGAGTLGIQLLGTAAITGTAAAFAFLIFLVLKLLGGIRVSEHEEMEGLDIGEHGMHAYPDFAVGSAGPAGYITQPGRGATVARAASELAAPPAVASPVPAG